MRHATHISDFGVAGLEAILSKAIDWKKGPHPKHLVDKILGLVFFNPSLRSRTSFEAVMLRGGGHAIVLEVGGGVWKLEDREGAIMNADRSEHLKEAVPVLARFTDGLAVRTFAENVDDERDHQDPVINGFRNYSTVPVISMESAREHPCQGLADMLTIRETFGKTKNVPVTLTWAPHIKPLPKAVPNSFLLSAAAAGCDVRIAHPKGFELHPSVIEEAQNYARESGGRLHFTNDQNEALEGSLVVYGKSWGPSTQSALPPESVKAHPDWMVSRTHMEKASQEAIFLHCLPTRRNVEIADDVLDHPSSRVIDEAENRFHVQRALVDWVLNA